MSEIIGFYIVSVLIVLVVYILVILRIKNTETNEPIISQSQEDKDRLLLEADPKERRKLLRGES